MCSRIKAITERQKKLQNYKKGQKGKNNSGELWGPARGCNHTAVTDGKNGRSLRTKKGGSREKK
jgi:hypothetical protein